MHLQFFTYDTPIANCNHACICQILILAGRKDSQRPIKDERPQKKCEINSSASIHAASIQAKSSTSVMSMCLKKIVFSIDRTLYSFHIERRGLCILCLVGDMEIDIIGFCIISFDLLYWHEYQNYLSLLFRDFRWCNYTFVPCYSI